MIRLILILAVVLTGCGPTPQLEPLEFDLESEPIEAETGSDSIDETENLVPQIFWINAHEFSQIPHRFVDAVNVIRARNKLPLVKLSSTLTAAARTHSRDMSVQNRPWHFGSDGSSPLDRVESVGYQGVLLGENISESFESDLLTLRAWMADSEARKLILNPKATEIGIGWHQESEGKIWWTLVAGA